MSSTRVDTLNLSDDGGGMVPLQDNPSTSFTPEKNISQHKETMDSTPINDIMMDHPMMTEEPKMQGVQMAAAQPQGMYAAPTQQVQEKKPASKYPLNLTDDQVVALLAGVCAAISVSKPIQDKLATSIPKFLNEQGGRSVVGLASTGVIAAIIFYIAKDYVVKA
jgi:hypothetical protein